MSHDYKGSGGRTILPLGDSKFVKLEEFLKDLGLELNIDFFNRINVWIEDNNGKISSIKYAELSKYPEFYFYNQLIEKASDLNTKFKIKVKNYLQNF